MTGSRNEQSNRLYIYIYVDLDLLFKSMSGKSQEISKVLDGLNLEAFWPVITGDLACFGLVDDPSCAHFFLSNQHEFSLNQVRKPS